MASPRNAGGPEREVTKTAKAVSESNLAATTTELSQESKSVEGGSNLAATETDKQRTPRRGDMLRRKKSDEEKTIELGGKGAARKFSTKLGSLSHTEPEDDIQSVRKAFFL